QSGKITVPTLELEVNVGVDFGSFWSAGTPRRKIIRNSPVNITVDDLPDSGKPASFAGAIGKFKLNGEINRTELKAGESFQYTITLSGEGNISQFSAPEFPALQNMRVMTPEVQNEAIDSKSGKKTVKYLVIAQEKGNYIIPPIEFSYFDTESRSYKVLKTREYALTVTEGDSRFGGAVGYVQSSVNLEGKDIAYIVAKKRVPDFKPYFSSFWYWLLIIIALALVPLTYYYVNEKDKLAGDADLMRQKNASRILKKYLTLASQHATKRSVEFYAAAQNGLIQYLTDKLRIAKGLTTDQILNDMTAKDTPAELVNRLSEFFDICNQARFMPGGFTGERISKDFESLKKLIQDVSRLKIKH
ncbi:MAG: BatD family protein, partial [Candidatus Cloacimonetes bacterium]|nr:BatD family protein [Candidatus Cloacimonadota bacterium]